MTDMPTPKATQAVEVTGNPFERWPGYDEQSWQQRFLELDRRYLAATKQFQDSLTRLASTPAAPANTGRAEVLEEAASLVERFFLAEYGMVSGKFLEHHRYAKSMARSIRALSSPPATTAPDGPSEDDKLYLAQEVACSTPTDATAVEAEREAGR